MLTVISPAKRLNLEAVPAPDLEPTEPQFASEAQRLARIARKLSVAQLQALMSISEPLARLNKDRFTSFGTVPGRPAALCFDGDTYAGLEAKTLDADAWRFAQDNLRILSGLYGLLRPMDLIQPYRLEMGSKLANPRGGDLYAFWGNRIAKALNAAGAAVLVNCASAEYFGAVDRKALKARVITPVFLEERGNEAKMISFWAKKARGAMARFIAENQLQDSADLRGFTSGGYLWRADLSDTDRLVFLRPEAAEAAA